MKILSVQQFDVQTIADYYRNTKNGICGNIDNYPRRDREGIIKAVDTMNKFSSCVTTRFLLV